MKKIFTLVALAMTTIQMQAQTITSANFPTAGEAWIEFQDSTGSLVNVSPAGAGQVWNYANSFNVSDTTGILFRPLSDAPAYMNLSSTFPNADMVVIDDLLDSSATTLESNADGFYYDGIYEHGLFVDTSLGINQNYMDFNPNRLLIPSPFSINDTRNNNARFGLTFTFSGITVDARTYFVQSFEADASGTLTTPLGTFNDVLRIREFTYTVDTTTYSLPIMPPETDVYDTTITYNFVHANSHCLLMTVEMDPITMQPKSASYYDPIVLVGSQNQNNVAVSFYPNPAKEEFYLNHVRNNSSIQIFDITGNLVHSQSLNGFENNIKVNTSDMPAGLYFFSLNNSNQGNYFNGKFEVVK